MAEASSRPLLLPQNRRLRHLQGISLRNLAFSRPRGRTIDDAALNKTPAKLEALRESLKEPTLQHAQSSDDLTRNVRPGKLRRRSTNWAGQSPSVRQKRLEDVIEGGTADTFFSIHFKDVEDPLYISETVEKSMVSYDEHLGLYLTTSADKSYRIRPFNSLTFQPMAQQSEGSKVSESKFG